MAEIDDACPICEEQFKRADLCATDIELGICHAACLQGSPTVHLETGEPFNGPISTYPYEPTGRQKCKNCDGTGSPDYAGFAMDICERCNGSGKEPLGGGSEADA